MGIRGDPVAHWKREHGLGLQPNQCKWKGWSRVQQKMKMFSLRYRVQIPADSSTLKSLQISVNSPYSRNSSCLGSYCADLAKESECRRDLCGYRHSGNRPAPWCGCECPGHTRIWSSQQSRVSCGQRQLLCARHRHRSISRSDAAAQDSGERRPRHGPAAP